MTILLNTTTDDGTHFQTRTYKSPVDRNRALALLIRTRRWSTLMPYRDTAGSALHMVSCPPPSSLPCGSPIPY